MKTIESNKQLVQLIRQEIEQSDNGGIPFQQFMGLCLYAPELGYYTGTRSKIGKKGDFYTSSAIGGLLGEILACYMVKSLLEKPCEVYEIVEWGGGTGQLAKQILDKLSLDFPEFYQRLHFIEIERSEFHRELQKVNLERHLARVSFWSPEEWKEQGKRTDTLVFSNELLDAFPVHRVRFKAGELYELYVGWDELKQVFYEREFSCHSNQILDYLESEQIVLKEGQTAE